MLVFWPVYFLAFKVAAEQVVLSPGQQTNPLINNILLNINVPDGLPGLAIASPSRENPDYYFHWIRDGALTMSAVLNASFAPGEEHLSDLLDQYISSSMRLQQVPNLSGGVGEPKFYVDGSAFNHPWGRPQSDGPALRALVTSKHAWYWWSPDLLDELYNTFIKTDIDYIVDVWQQPSFDLWEELYGYHFFTSISHYGALRAVSALTRRAGLIEQADQYAKVSEEVALFIENHFLGCSDFICEHVPYNLGGRSSLDVASVLAVLELHDLAGWTEDDKQLGPLFLGVDHPLLSKTVEALIVDFMYRFPINHGQPGGIGRYPEDVYDGNGRSLGNPWFIATAAVAEYLVLTDQRERAGLHVKFINQHRGVTLSEQINRYTGFMQGAANLTWSYSAVRRLELLL